MDISLPQINGHDLLTHSRRQAFKRCRRFHYYSYLLGLRRIATPKPLRFGSAFHLGLDLRAKGASPEDAVVQAVVGYSDFPAWCHDDEARQDWLIERTQVARLLNGYFWYWERDGLPANITAAEVVESEMNFAQPLRNPETGAPSTIYKMAGKLDKIVRLGDGRLALMEHKTTGDDISPTSDYWKKLRIDEQISGYVVAARNNGHDILTVLYDVARKPTIGPLTIAELDADGLKIVVDANGERAYLANGKPRQAGDAAKGLTLLSRKQTPEEYGERLMADITSRPEWYYARQEIPRTLSDIEEFTQDLWDTQRDMREAVKHHRHYRNTGACNAFNKTCEFIEICARGTQVDEVPEGFEVVTELHQELATEEK